MTNRTANMILFLACLLLISLAYLTIHINAPYGITTMSRALYVDEGFYSDAAQNFVKFGDWGQAFDLRHWPGAPMLTIIQTAVFSIFGVSVTAVRLISVTFAVISIVSLYFIGRLRFSPALSLCLSITAAITISFASHARAAIADPIAVGFSMLALLIYLRLDNRIWAIVLSMLAAYFAFCSKMYFLFVPITLIIFWFVDIIILPRYGKSHIVRPQVWAFLVTILLIASSYILLRLAFNDSFAQFMHINSNKLPNFDLIVLFKQFLIALEHLPFNTKTHVFLICLVLVFFYVVVTKLFRGNVHGAIQLAKVWGREGWVMSVFLLLGIGTITALNIPTKAHYYYFSILPICFLAVLGVKVFLTKKLVVPMVLAILISHIVVQAIYYSQWLSRTELLSVDHASKSIVSFIEKENPNADEIVAIIGQYASQLGLYSNQLMPLDLRWSTKKQVCNRVDYWRPKYHVDFHFPARGNYSEQILSSCEQVGRLDEISQLPVFEQWQDEIVIHRITYNDQ